MDLGSSEKQARTNVLRSLTEAVRYALPRDYNRALSLIDNIPFYLWQLCDEGTPHYQCKVCGQLEYIKKDKSEPECFMCKLWEERIAEITNFETPGQVSQIINNVYYSGRDWKDLTKHRSDFLGHAGRAFFIQTLHTNEIYRCNNLWYGGEVPVCHRAKLPDTAKFLTMESWFIKMRERGANPETDIGHRYTNQRFNSEDICVWPDETFCLAEELEDMLQMKSDDYRRIQYGTKEYRTAHIKFYGCDPYILEK